MAFSIYGETCLEEYSPDAAKFAQTLCDAGRTGKWVEACPTKGLVGGCANRESKQVQWFYTAADARRAECEGSWLVDRSKAVDFFEVPLTREKVAGALARYCSATLLEKFYSNENGNEVRLDVASQHLISEAAHGEPPSLVLMRPASAVAVSGSQ